eukprot:SAG22_NODE_7772_length_709_cov_1.980328_1_plen_162_part_10
MAGTATADRGMQSSYMPKPGAAADISFEDIGRFPGRACVGRMGAPNSPGFSPDDASVVFLQSGAGSSLTQHLAAVDMASGEVSVMAKAPEGAGEEGSISAEEKLRRERARQLHTGITAFAWADETDSLLCPIGNDLFVMRGVGTPLRGLLDPKGGLLHRQPI